MAISSVNPNILSATPSAQSSSSRLPMQVLGQQDFLKLLVAQLSAQDPMNPQKDTDFIAQMATFSSLEQSKSMQVDIGELRQDQQVIQANALLGRTVEVMTGQSSKGEPLLTAGLVTSVQFEAGMPKVVVNGHSYDLSQLTTITQ